MRVNRRSTRARASYFGVDKAKDYEEYKKKYREAVEDLEYVHYTGFKSERLVEEFEKELGRMPLAHRALAESRISEIEITESKRGSSYTKSSEIVRISKYAEPGDIIHEYSHAMEVGLDIYHDPEFIKIWKSGLENVTVNDIIYDEEIFETPIYRIINDKLVSDYQGRLYKEYGIFDGTKLNLEGMREYFSEGYTTYIMNPEKLKKHDPKLFRFIEEIGT